MNTFHFRDARKQLLLEALAALGDQPNDLRDPLQQELDAIQQDSWLVADKTYLVVGVDWLWSFSLTLKMAVDEDPALMALGRPARISAAQAGAIESIPHGPGGPPADYIEQVRAAVDNDELIFSELLFAAHHDWIVQPADSRKYPFDDVGVLLPVRLETLFDMPNTEFNNDPTRWKLSLRVIPDEASICRDNHFVSNDERTVVTAFWNTIRQPGTPDASWLDSDLAAVAWQQLADQVTPARAAWLVANLPTAIEGDRIVVNPPPDMPADTQPNRVGGFPPELHVTINLKEEVDGEFQKTVGRLPQDPDKMIDTEALTLPLPSKAETKAETKRQQWWNNWKQAIEIGVAGEFPLPQGVTPENIDAIYVVGIGDEAPLAHFKAQVDSGELAILPLGVPTNTIHGKAAADLGKTAEDWRKVAQQRLRQRADSSFNPFKEAGINLQRHLLGAETRLPFFPTGDIDDDTLDSQHMAQALWPALWGYWLRDLWQMGDNAFRVGKWMTENFYPEGPLMPLRISDQPYGILPVTQLAAWQTLPTFHQEAETQAALESAMADLLVRIRAEWQTLVKDKRSIVGKSSAEFMQLLGQNALSRRYLQRKFSPAWVPGAPYIARGLDPAQFLDRVSEFYKLPLDRLHLAGLEPVERYLTYSYWLPQELPLVQPNAMSYLLRNHNEKERLGLLELFEGIFDYWYSGQGEVHGMDIFFTEFQRHVLPDSLLIRLLTHAVQLAALWSKSPTISAQDIVVGAQKDSLEKIAKELDKTIEPEATGQGLQYIMVIPDQRRRQLERALRATLDSAATRIDPWMVGFAWQRLKTQSQGLQRNHRLGVYGWVDGPFQGTPGPTDAGRLHTPSYNQTLAALILRDKFLSSARAELINEDEGNPWAMNISSAKARLAEEIADEVRMGFHIYEIVGRHVENIVGNHQQVKALRIHPQYAMRPERQDSNEVCNGIEALLGLLKDNGAFQLPDGQSYQLNDRHILALQQLHDALDCYSDLLVADGVMQLVNRQVDRAAETLDAATGFSRPPSFEFLRTPPSGYLLESVVISALPYVTTDATENSPIRLAEPSLAAYLDQHLAGEWQWQAKDATGNLLGTVSLAELGFVPHETIALSQDFFKELAQRKLGLEQTTEIIAPRQLTMAQEIAAALGNRPAAGRDFGSKSTVQQVIDLAVYEELRMRFEQLWEKCDLLVDQLQNAADDIIRADLLLQAIRWGVIPISTEGYALRLRSVTEIDKIDDQGQSLVIIALVGTDLHIRIFDANKTRIVDKSEAELVDLPDLTVTAFKQRLTPFPRMSALSQADKQAMINNATLLAGHTPNEAADREVLFALLLGQSVSESAAKRLAVNMGKVLQGRLNSAPEIDAGQHTTR